MPKRKVTSAPWVPVPARAYTGKAPRARQHRAVGRLSAGAPRLHKSCRWRRPQSKGRSCRSGRARRDLRVRGGRGHLSERPGWPSGSPISRGSTVSMIAFGGRRGPHRSGSRCRGRPIERREAGREGCLWPNAASQGRPPDGSGGESERSTQNGRAKTLCGGGGGGGGGSNSELPQAGFPESGEVCACHVHLCTSMFVWALLFRPGWRHLVPGGGGEIKDIQTPSRATHAPSPVEERAHNAETPHTAFRFPAPPLAHPPRAARAPPPAPRAFPARRSRGPAALIPIPNARPPRRGVAPVLTPSPTAPPAPLRRPRPT